MTTAEYIVCILMDCGELDIETMFGTITESDLFSEAVNNLRNMQVPLTASAVWQECIELALYQTFGSEVNLELFKIDNNYIGSSVRFLGDKDEIEDFDEKAEKFSELTGFDIQG